MNDPDKQRGMYPKYRVEKLNGKPVGPCFVLEFKDRHARAALRAYAVSCEAEFPKLAADLRAQIAVAAAEAADDE